MNKKLCMLVVILFMFSFLTAKGYNYVNYLPASIVKDNVIQFSLNLCNTKKEFYIYYRTKGVKTFQVRKMQLDHNNRPCYKLSTENLYGDKLQYFILEKGQNIKDSISTVYTITNFSKKKSPEIYFQDTSSAANTAAKKSEPLLKFGASLSTETRIYDKESSTTKAFSANGTFRVYRNIVDDDFAMDFDSNFTYTNQAMANESEINLSNMLIRVKKGNHKVEIGDVSITGSDYSTSYLSRRGLNYSMTGTTLYLQSFFTNAQQKTGFDGFGIPMTSDNLFGVIAGVNLFSNNLSLKGILVTGFDKVDSKTLVSTDDANIREGSIWAVWGNVQLLNNQVTLKGEYAHSSFGKAADEDDINPVGGTAWNTGLNFTYGPVSGNVGFKKIGSKFNSIANLFLDNDREGIDGGINLNLSNLMFSVTYMDQKSYIESTDTNTKHSKNLTSSLTWTIAKHWQIGGDFGFNNLDFDEKLGLSNSSDTAMETLNYALKLGYIAGANSVSLRVGKDESKNFTSNLSGSLTISIAIGSAFTFAPSVSYTSTDNFTNNTTSEMLSVYLSSTIQFVPQIFSLSLTGSYSDTKNSDSHNTSMALEANLSVSMSKFFNYKVTPSLALKSKYRKDDSYGQKTDSVAFYLQANIGF